MTKIWRSASQEMVSRLREFCFHTSWYRKKKRKEKKKVCEIGKRERAKKKSYCFGVCTNLCMQLWLAGFTKFVICLSKKKTATQPQLHSQRGGICHLHRCADLLSGFMKAGHFQYEKTAVLCGTEAPLLEQAAGQSHVLTPVGAS